MHKIRTKIIHITIDKSNITGLALEGNVEEWGVKIITPFVMIKNIVDI